MPIAIARRIKIKRRWSRRGRACRVEVLLAVVVMGCFSKSDGGLVGERKSGF